MELRGSRAWPLGGDSYPSTQQAEKLRASVVALIEVGSGPRGHGGEKFRGGVVEIHGRLRKPGEGEQSLPSPLCCLVQYGSGGMLLVLCMSAALLTVRQLAPSVTRGQHHALLWRPWPSNVECACLARRNQLWEARRGWLGVRVLAFKAHDQSYRASPPLLFTSRRVVEAGQGQREAAAAARRTIFMSIRNKRHNRRFKKPRDRAGDKYHYRPKLSGKVPGTPQRNRLT